MEDNQQQQQQQQNPSSNINTSSPPPPRHGGSNKSSSNNEPVRSRWTPKPEQILILESIFSSGMVNPPKDETVRIRKLLEKFGAVGDANVFYWFQNRRSRSRRRQRQMQSAAANNNLVLNSSNDQTPTSTSSSSSSSSSTSSSSSSSCFDPPSNSLTFLIGDGGVGVGGSSSSSSSSSSVGRGGLGIGLGNCCGDEDGCLYSISNQMGLTEMEQCQNMICSSDTSSNMNNYQQQQQQPPPPAGFITVFINGVPNEVPNGSLDMRNMFGQDVMLVHSSGVPVPFNEYGFSLHSLQMGESYFLVSRSI